MPEILKKIDARISTDADSNNYYIAFCSRDSSNPSNKPGHAFVLWGIEDSGSAMSSEKAFGFYPDENDELKAVFNYDVPGELKDGAINSSPSSLLTARLIVQVNKSPFFNSQSKIDEWRTSDYNLYSKNCIHFVRSVAVSLGLFPPPIGTFQVPTLYLNELIKNTSGNQ